MTPQIDTNNIPLLLLALLMLAGSFLVFYKNKKWGLILLITSSGLIALFMAMIDPFLNLWDEQQHALVAKHMARNPFYPVLFKDPILEYDYKFWIQNHIWIHKQPLFLWQMALSIKLFGANVLAARIPSVIMHALLPLIIYHIGKIVRNAETGFIAAIFITVAHFPLELISGRYATDHNDMAFLFYVSLSLLFWFKYQQSGERKWLIWLGVTAGAAVLVKWLMGLIVYVCWFIVITVKNNFKVWQVRSYFVMIVPFLISLLIFLPWQIYCFVRFPREAAHEFGAAASHFSTAVEGHTGEWTFHFREAFDVLYHPNDLIEALILIFCLIGIWCIKDLRYKVFIGFMIGFVYVFFTLAATKMPGFTLIGMPLVVIATASALLYLKEWYARWIKNPFLSYLLLGVILAYPVYAFFQWDKIQINHAVDHWENAGRQNELRELEMIEDLKEKYGGKKTVIFNGDITLVGNISIMYFSDFIAYPQVPVDKEIRRVLNAGYDCVIVDQGDVPSEYYNDPRIEIYPFNH